MKRVRIMLAAIAVLGVVGGALAFKAKLPNPPYCFVNTTATTLCTTNLPAGLTVRNGQAIHYITTNNTAACPGYTRCTIPAVSGGE